MCMDVAVWGGEHYKIVVPKLTLFQRLGMHVSLYQEKMLDNALSFAMIKTRWKALSNMLHPPECPLLCAMPGNFGVMADVAGCGGATAGQEHVLEHTDHVQVQVPCQTFHVIAPCDAYNSALAPVMSKLQPKHITVLCESTSNHLYLAHVNGPLQMAADVGKGLGSVFVPLQLLAVHRAYSETEWQGFVEALAALLRAAESMVLWLDGRLPTLDEYKAIRRCAALVYLSALSFRLDWVATCMPWASSKGQEADYWWVHCPKGPPDWSSLEGWGISVHYSGTT
ncbi:uncharacterized protein MEPE_03345 [Melanopsichium pennsylvanicum]|uniref:Uncharacterized protein n=2 Tax=Melanopsichium pennsylvanicum TaxID=63383 RepID=A0AAJ4XMI0_9BASI|nr:uncharacterized protein BN887_00381 [Melanopsichium pennsylvanicum 4]SNX84636.1 uncharacterized protein MEPE_03345 [Melanopsichium pennsylvanicum]